MPDILLIQPPIQDFYITYKRTVPYGLACIAATLMQNGFSVSLFDSLATARSRDIAWPEEMAYLKPYYGLPDSSPFALFHRFRHFGYSFEYIGKIARESGAFLVGISALFTTYAECARQTAFVVKKWLPDCKIVMGGHHPTTMPEDMMACEAVDFIIRGEGEAAMPQLAKSLKNGLVLETIPGIVFRKPDGSVYQAEPAIMDDPDAFPRPSLRHIKHNFYKRGKKRSAVIVTSRGCPLKCTYCCTGKHSFLRFRQKNVASVLKEIENAVLNYDARFIDFEDENLSLNKRWFLKLLDAITSRFQNYDLELRAMNGLFPPSLDRDVIQAMQTAGFKTLNLGLCTTDKAQLRRFQRPDVSTASDRALNLAEYYDMQAVSYIIAGAPYQNAFNTVSDLIYLAQRRVLAGLSVFYPAPGSRDFELTRDLGILPEKYTLLRSSTLPLNHTTTRIQAATLLRLTRILNFMKQMTDDGISFPEPIPPESGNCFENPDDRIQNGKLLLSQFFYDGKIRGVLKDGTVFEHATDVHLTRMFIQEIKRVTVRGMER
jgi:radical SAM superfamily enzyme YgiQ (UPF0313 family)